MDIIRFWQDGEVMRLWDAKMECVVKDNGEINCVVLKAGNWRLIYER